MKKIIQTAFTLIELLVVIAIIGILSGLIVVTMNGVTQKANIAKAQVFSNSLRNALMLNLISEWKFDGAGLNDGDNATIAYVQDTWSGGNSCSINGTPKVKTGVNCVGGSCLLFNGSTDSLDCGNSSSLNMGGSSVTIGTWIKLNSLNVYHNIINKRGAASTWPYQIDVNNSNNVLDFSVQGTAYGVITSGNSLSAGTWYYVVGIRDAAAGKLYLYINGVSAATPVSESVGNTSNTAILAIGNRSSANFFNGLMDDTRIFNAAMPVSRIRSDYYAGLNNIFSVGRISAEEYNQRIKTLILHE